MPDRQAIEQQILALLPEDGSPVLNRAMMVLIGRRLAVRVDAATYFSALDALATAELIVRHRGQGGKIARATPSQRAPAMADAAWPEAKLMPSLHKYLETLFWRSLDLPTGLTTLDETPVVPVAMAIGASPESSPTYQQKYPSPLNRVLERLTTEIEEALQ